VESELHFEWPDGSGPTPLVEAFSESRPLARRRRGARRMAEAAKGAEHAEPTDVHRALEEAREAGLELIDQEPRIGLHGSRIAFLHPRTMGGVLTELVEST